MIDDPRFSTPASRFENREAMENLIEEALQEQTTETWATILQTEDIAFAPINTLDKVMVDPQVVHNKSIITVKHSKYGEFKAIDNAIKVQGIEGEHTPPPLIGEHTEEVLKGILGYSDDKIRRLNEEAEKHSAELKSHVQRVL
jgi:crotonobetainyl-CoA:carnitine CoA-transferase CaiB-like acyl-CoA transferase